MNTDLPEEVRAWWREQFRMPGPYSSLLAAARQRWPERDCGRDSVVVMYGWANEIEVAA